MREQPGLGVPARGRKWAQGMDEQGLRHRLHPGTGSRSFCGCSRAMPRPAADVLASSCALLGLISQRSGTGGAPGDTAASLSPLPCAWVSWEQSSRGSCSPQENPGVL